jgi:hypothetical protein
MKVYLCLFASGLGPMLIVGSVSTMVFGMCATRVIGFVVGFTQDLIALRKPVANTPVNATGARVEEVTFAEKKEL